MGGLAGTGLVLHSSLGDDLAIGANGAFTFPTTAPQAQAYAVTVAQHPTSPWQTCTVARGSGTMGAANVTDVAVTCTTNTYAVGGTVSGLAAGETLVLRNNGGDDETIDANGSFTFATAVASGSGYEVSFVAAPGGKTCSVANGSGTVAGAAITNVAVTCASAAFTVGGTVTGLAAGGTLVLQNNGGDDETVAANGAFTFDTPVASGGAYAVTVLTNPTGQTCAVADGSGTVGSAAVTDVAVTCTDVTLTFSLGGTVSGLVGTGLVLHAEVGALAENVPVADSGPFTFPTQIGDGAAYAVTVLTQPSSSHCNVVNGIGVVSGANVSVEVACGPVIQRWQSPTTWGARWPDSPTMLQHAYFDGTGLVSAKGPALGWIPHDGGAEPAPAPLDVFPSGTRFGVGPFTDGHYQGPTEDGLALPNDMLVCAIVKPDHNPVLDIDGTEKTIVAKGIAKGVLPVFGGGWVLMQMHHHWCFHYQSIAGAVSEFNMAATPTYFPDRDREDNGPLNPSYVVVCGGRAGDQIVVAANSADTELIADPLPVGSRLDAGLHPLTIGGSDTSDPLMEYGGRVYETAVWAEPATLANIRAKFAAIQGLTLPGGAIAQYTRNREGPFMVGGKYHTTWRSGPRIDPAKGFLFGLQSWNRVITEYIPTDPNQASRFIATGEAFEEWVRSGGATVDGTTTAVPPGASEFASARLIRLPPGAALSTILARNMGLGFDSAGLIHGQIWLRVPSPQAGTLTVRVTNPAPGGSDSFGIDLGALVPDAANGGWTRIPLRRGAGGPGNELTTAGPGSPGSVLLRNEGTSTLSFWAWGLVLTQLGGGGDLGGFDAGPEMFEGSLRGGDLERNLDFLQLPTLADGTAATGYCLSVDAQPAPGLSWTAPFAKQRALLSWVKDGQGARLTSEAVNGRVCFGVTGAGTRPCFDPAAPALSWTPGSKHNVKGCVSATGDVTLYADGVQLGNPATGATALDLAGGRLVLGGDLAGLSISPWHGYISKTLACFNNGSPASCE